MKLLYLVPKEVYDTKMSRVRFQQVDYINRLDNVKVHITGPGWPDWDESVPLANRYYTIRGAFGHIDMALSYGVGDLADLPCPLATSYNEADEHWKVESYIYSNNVKLVIFHHENDIQHYQHLIDKGIALTHIQHCADTEVYKDYGLEKTIDVLVAGNTSHKMYPHRYRLKHLALALRKRNYNVRILEHPGYTFPIREGTVVGADFAKIVNQSKIVFTCSMKFHYALAKYSEIALCKSLAGGDLPDERRSFFEETVLELAPWMTDEEILRKVEGVLDNQDLREKLTAASYDANKRYCTMGTYASKFYEATSHFLVAGGYAKS